MARFEARTTDYGLLLQRKDAHDYREDANHMHGMRHGPPAIMDCQRAGGGRSLKRGANPRLFFRSYMRFIIALASIDKPMCHVL